MFKLAWSDAFGSRGEGRGGGLWSHLKTGLYRQSGYYHILHSVPSTSPSFLLMLISHIRDFLEDCVETWYDKKIVLNLIVITNLARNQYNKRT